MENSSIVFLLGCNVRSGTNYLSNFLNIHPKISVIPENNTRLETPWLDRLNMFDAAWRSFDDRFSQRPFFCLSRSLRYDEFCGYLSSAFVEYLKDSYQYDRKAKYLLLKNPSFVNLSLFFKAFPAGKLILIVRDGRDNLVSCSKAYIRKDTRITFRSIKKYINRWTFREFISIVMYWRNSIQTLLRFQNSDDYKNNKDSVMLVKYEDLVHNPREEAVKIFDFLNLESSHEVLNEIDSLKVVGSSFYSPDGNEGARKPNWTTAVSKSDRFRPVGRWKKWSFLKKWLFKRIAGDQLILMGYENNRDW